MQVVAPSPAHVTATPNAVMTGLAAPSRGSTELSTWRVRMEAEAAGPVHTADREQVWTVLNGALEFTCEGRPPPSPRAGPPSSRPGRRAGCGRCGARPRRWSR